MRHLILITSLLFATTSCACAGFNCSIGNESIHARLNERLAILNNTSIREAK